MLDIVHPFYITTMPNQDKNTIEDQSLLKSLKEGNQLAFSIIYKRYAAQAFSLSFKYLFNKELAEDTVQNLFLKLWVKREDIDETRPINRYIFTILKNDLLNILRDSKKNFFLLEDCISMLIELEEDSKNDNFDSEQIEIIKKAIEGLSPQKRKIFKMKIWGKYSNQQIAEELNLSINTIKFQYSQSIKQIRLTIRDLSILLLVNHIF